MKDVSCLEPIIVGRVEPHIYAFTTNTIPHYLKVGETYRPVALRLKEWSVFFKNLHRQYEDSAKINDDVYFRDFAVHRFLEKDKHRERLTPDKIDETVYYSREFFKNATAADIQEAIADIKRDYERNSGNHTYKFYNAQDSLPVLDEYPRTDNYDLRPNQRETVERFRIAAANGRTNLLMYAVMRFGKSFTSMCCAVAIKAKLVVVVSAKADVKEEWKKTVQSHIKFKDYSFVTSDDLNGDSHKITGLLGADKRCVAFLTLQDLQGTVIKEKHKEIFGNQIDLLLVDETHFGARAEKFGQVLPGAMHNLDSDDYCDAADAEEIIKTLKAKITIHLSGTPYRILMGSEFEKEDIIAFYQFSDIVDEQTRWDEANRKKPEAQIQEDWENPYFGFPQMIRFAFNPNESSRQLLAKLKNNGISYAMAALFEPKSIKKSADGAHKEFKFESEILDLLLVIDGQKDDDELLGFLDYEKIKKGEMCRHIVMVLPYCASCDALESLLVNHHSEFKHLSEYEIINISGVDAPQKYRKPEIIKEAIHNCEAKKQKTITLTVNRMLTGSTVPEWDTMLFFKDTASPQEYDQAAFRLQNQYVRIYKTDKIDETDKTQTDEIKYNMKPQTLFVDFSPERVFRMQEMKSQIYNVNMDSSGNDHLRARLKKELKISPIIVANKDKLVQVQASDIIDFVRNYSKSRGVADEVMEIPVDLTLLKIDEIRQVIEQENELGSREGLTITANQGDEKEMEVPPEGGKPADANDSGHGQTNSDNQAGSNNKDKNQKDPVKQFRTFYSRILFFAFLTNDQVHSLRDIIKVIDKPVNVRIADNLGINRAALKALPKMHWAALKHFDNKVYNINTLSEDTNAEPLERCKNAIQKFGKLGVSEIVTPANICDDMVALFPDEKWRSIVANGDKILDIASKAAEFPMAVCRKLWSIGFETKSFKNSLLSIPTSPVAYEFTRKMYNELGLDISCISTSFTSYDLLGVKTSSGEVDYAKIKDILTQDKSFDAITLNDIVSEGGHIVNISVVIGNPPYQVLANGEANGADPIYHLFIDAGYAISNRGSFIHPGRFLFNAGKTPKDWNEKILKSEHFKVASYWANSEALFPRINIMGGIAITYWNREEHFKPIGVFIAHDLLREILNKVVVDQFQSLTSIMEVQSKYNFTTLYKKFPHYRDIIGSNGTDKRLRPNAFVKLNIFSEEEHPGDCCIHGLIKNKRVLRFIPRKYLEENPILDKYKILVPKANGSSSIGEGLATPVIGEPLIAGPSFGFTGSFISIGQFNNEKTAKACLKYIKSKFARAMLGTLKVTQDNPIETWGNVPLQNFTRKSDIDWSKSIPEIDQQLYKKYGLTKEEIAFIESMIKPME